MFRNSITIFLLEALLISFSACTKPVDTSIKAFVVHSGTGQFLLAQSAEEFQDPKAPSEATVIFEGKEFTGTYEKTCSSGYRPYLVRKYRGDGVSFELSKEDGSLESIEILGKSQHFTKTELEEFAYRYVSKYANPEDFPMESDASTGGMRTVEYYPKTLLGLNVWEGATFFVSNGKYFSCNDIMLGDYPTEDTLTEQERDTLIRLQSEEAKEFLENYIHTLSEGVTSIEYDEPMIILLEDHKLALLYSVSIKKGTLGERLPIVLYI